MKFWPTFWGSFYSPQTYHRVRYESYGWGFFYAFVLVAFTTFFGTLLLAFFFHQTVIAPRDGKPPLLDNVLAQVAQQLPVLNIYRGELTVDAPQPLTIRVHDKVQGYEFDTLLATIDTTGATDHHNMTSSVLVTKNDIITRKSNGETSIRSLRKLTPDPETLYTREDVQHALLGAPDLVHRHMWKLYLVMIPLLWGALTVGFFISRAFMLLAVGLIALIAGNVSSPKMDFMASVRLSSVAYTPVAVFHALAFIVLFDTAGTLTLFALGAVLAVLAVVLTNPPRAAA